MVMQKSFILCYVGCFLGNCSGCSAVWIIFVQKLEMLLDNAQTFW